MSFEWDEEKRLSNLAKHRLNFSRAQTLFEADSQYIETRSEAEDEERWLRTGIVDGEFVTIVWTRREDSIRFISFRRARREERREYLDRYLGRAPQDE